jgi:hypothetical protein
MTSANLQTLAAIAAFERTPYAKLGSGKAAQLNLYWRADLSACEGHMREHNDVLLDAEEQLASASTLGDMRRARDNLRTALPDCPLLKLLEAKIARTKEADWPNACPFSA